MSEISDTWEAVGRRIWFSLATDKNERPDLKKQNKARNW
jgi:hypothetical protein